jgi:hypothetical protein
MAYTQDISAVFQGAQINIKTESHEAFKFNSGDGGSTCLPSLHAEWLVAPVDVEDNMVVQTIFCKDDWNLVSAGHWVCVLLLLSLGLFS